ncbi:MAG: hypothetical protein WBK15_11705 [Yoonia sp.]
MSGYIGTQPVPQATQTRQTFVATAAQTSFATGGYQAGYLDVFLNGVKLQDGVDYTATNGSDIVLTVGAALDDTLEVVAYTAFEVVNAATAAQGALADTAVQPNDSPTFADLTLSGGVYLGGTGAANKLDDYEEATWTPTFVRTGNGPSSITGLTVDEAVYTKIGNFVRVRAKVSLDRAVEATFAVGNYFTLGGLPFIANTLGSTGLYGTIGQCHVYESLGSNSNAWGFVAMNSNGTDYNMLLQTLNGNPDTGDPIFIDMSYTT